MRIQLTTLEENQLNMILEKLLIFPTRTFYLREILTTQPCSARVGRAFFENVTSKSPNIPNIIVSNIDGAGAVQYEKIV